MKCEYVHSDSFLSRLHFHKEIQFTYIHKGSGVLIIGDQSVMYKSGDLFLIGERLSHMFISDSNQISESSMIYVSKSFLLNTFPNNYFINHLITKSSSGIKFLDVHNKEKFYVIVNQTGIKLMKTFMDILDDLSTLNRKEIINNERVEMVKNISRSNRLKVVSNYVLNNYKKNITLSEVSKLANMVAPAFSAYYKKKTGKTFSRYVMEVRIEMACRLLLNDDFTVEEIAYKVGYNNFSNFNLQFKKIKNTTPKQYRNNIINSNL